MVLQTEYSEKEYLRSRGSVVCELIALNTLRELRNAYFSCHEHNGMTEAHKTVVQYKINLLARALEIKYFLMPMFQGFDKSRFMTWVTMSIGVVPEDGPYTPTMMNDDLRIADFMQEDAAFMLSLIHI
eukprot:TRINITY_DN3485_c0_g1_i3.p2 TRINITY_DN3485_c0_g1~~TRINITY_DN3485_c0_g1_i3.p2  ORF type:complete len:128 (-),score=27.09 TRINITY_DN3485_c0_g1_i3:60-443(-)